MKTIERAFIGARPALPERADDKPFGEHGVLVRLLTRLGSRDDSDLMPELVPNPGAVSHCGDASGKAPYAEGCFAMTVVSGSFKAPNGRDWQIRRGDTLVVSPKPWTIEVDDVILAIHDGAPTLILCNEKAEYRSLRNGELVSGDLIVVGPVTEYRALGVV